MFLEMLAHYYGSVGVDNDGDGLIDEDPWGDSNGDGILMMTEIVCHSQQNTKIRMEMETLVAR